MSLPPGPTQPSFVTLWRWIFRPLELLDECAARYGETFTLRIGGLPPQVVFSAPEDLRAVFSAGSDELYAGEFNGNLRPLLGQESVLFADGDEHMLQRRARMAAVLTDMLHLGTRPLLLLPLLQRDLGPLSPWGRFLRKVEEVDRLLFDELYRRRAEPPGARTDVLSLLLEARDEEGRLMSDRDLRDQLVTLVGAGHETTATSLAWALRWILADPLLVARLREEISASREGGALIPELIAKLPLLDATVREALRLQPVFPLIGRILKQSVELGGYTLAEGTVVLCSIYLAHRREAVYPRPASFDPDRFQSLKPSPYEWLPFGGGVRRCIGMAFALYQMKMVLAMVLSRASLRLAARRPLRAVRRSITLVPSEGLPLILDARAGAAPRERVQGS